jgi:ribosome-associated protein
MTRPLTLAKKIAQFMLTKKAHDVVMMDVRGLTDIVDFFVIGSADSDIQVKAIADAVIEGTEKIGSAVWHTEGISERQWVLLDYVDVVAHIFHKDARKFYGLEKLWGDAKIIEMKDKEQPVKPARTSGKRKKLKSNEALSP